jgi:hypothetical protein
MATQSDLDRLDKVINSGVKRVRDRQGSETEFHSPEELQRVRSDLAAEVAGDKSGGFRVRRMRMGKGHC